MEANIAEKRGLEPLGRYVGMAVTGTKPDEMGIGPVIAVPKLTRRFGLGAVCDRYHVRRWRNGRGQPVKVL